VEALSFKLNENVDEVLCLYNMTINSCLSILFNIVRSPSEIYLEAPDPNMVP
jgi:hypothetical protein